MPRDRCAEQHSKHTKQPWGSDVTPGGERDAQIRCDSTKGVLQSQQIRFWGRRSNFSRSLPVVWFTEEPFAVVEGAGGLEKEALAGGGRAAESFIVLRCFYQEGARYLSLGCFAQSAVFPPTRSAV